MRHPRAVLLAAAVAAAAITMPSACAQQQDTGSWTVYGGNEPNYNYHKATTNGIGASNAPQLQELFKVKLDANVSATPAVYKGIVYFPDWNGYLWAVDSMTGALVWKKKLADLIPEAPTTGTLVARVTPAIDTTTGLMVLGTQPAEPTYGEFAWIFAVTLQGDVAWKTNVAYNPYAIVTMSPIIYRDGKVVWQTYVCPDNHGNPELFSGIAVWGNAPAVDTYRNQVYIGTGNNYKVPKWVRECLKQSKTKAAKAHCAAVPDNWYDAIVAFDIDTGAIVWGQRMSAYDVWTVACEKNTLLQNCKVPSSPDYDFAQGPLYFPRHKCNIHGVDTVLDILVAAQKSGHVHAFNAGDYPNGCMNPDRVLWSTFTGTGGITGGSEFGSTSDGVSTVFVQNTNSDNKKVNLTNPAPGSNSTTTAGFWTAVDICTGKIKWQTAAPNGDEAYPAGGPTYSTTGAADDGVVFAPTLDSKGTVYALRATDGQVISSFSVGASTACAPAIVDNVLYIGSGYHDPGTTAGNYTYAFSLPGIQPATPGQLPYPGVKPCPYRHASPSPSSSSPTPSSSSPSPSSTSGSGYHGNGGPSPKSSLSSPPQQPPPQPPSQTPSSSSSPAMPEGSQGSSSPTYGY